MLQVTRRQISFIASAAEARSREGVVNLQKSVGNLGPTLALVGWGACATCSRGGFVPGFLCSIWLRDGKIWKSGSLVLLEK